MIDFYCLRLLATFEALLAHPVPSTGIARYGRFLNRWLKHLPNVILSKRHAERFKFLPDLFKLELVPFYPLFYLEIFSR